MKRRPDPRRSIYTELALLLLLAAAIAGLFFVASTNINTYIYENIFDRSRYARQQREYAAIELQSFVDEHAISSETISGINEFRRDNQELILQIIDSGVIIYDSETMDDNLLSGYPSDKYDASNNFPLELSDKSVIVNIEGSFGYKLYARVYFINVLITLLVFIIIILIGVTKKIDYIKKLKEEISLLESGTLDYEISIQGQDELAALALGLDTMRVSFKRQMDELEALSLTNQKMITEISHDLRTPLTAVLLYSEILHNGKNLTDEKKLEILDKIVKKIEHMKNLSDHLLSYSATSQLLPSIPLYSQNPKQVLYDELSDLCGYLSEQGFMVENEFAWADVKIKVNDESVSRIFNNISSNILKYADKAQPILVRCGLDENYFSLSFSNVPSATPHKDSSGIGVSSVRSLMKELGGMCKVTSDSQHYEICLSFSVSE